MFQNLNTVINDKQWCFFILQLIFFQFNFIYKLSPSSTQYSQTVQMSLQEDVRLTATQRYTKYSVKYKVLKKKSGTTLSFFLQFKVIKIKVL